MDRVVLVVANGARIFENNELIQAQTWDDNIVDKALAHFEARACQDQFVVTGMKGGFVKEGTIFTDLESFMTPEMIEKFYQRMQFVDELTSDLFGGVLKMSMVVGEERLSLVLKKSMTSLMAVFGLYQVAMVALISSKLGFIKHGAWKNYSSVGT